MKPKECWGGPLDGRAAPPSLLIKEKIAFPAPGGWYYLRGKRYVWMEGWYIAEDRNFWLTHAPVELVQRFGK